MNMTSKWPGSPSGPAVQLALMIFIGRVCSLGLRRARGDVRRADVRQGGPGAAGPGGAGGVPVRGGGARLGVLHLPGPRRDGPAAGDRPAAGGDGAARADEPGQLRPTVPVPGPAPGRPDDFYAALTARGKAARSQYNAAHTPPLTTETYTGGLLPGREDELRWKAEHAVRCGTPPARNRVLPAARVAP